MKIKLENEYEFNDWFAWRPVRCYEVGQELNEVARDTYLVWLEKIERKKIDGYWFKRLKKLNKYNV